LISTLKQRKKTERKMELQTFPREEKKEKEKTLIDKILKIIIVGLLMMIVVLLIDATGVLAQTYEQAFGEFPDSWILKPISDWYEEKIENGQNARAPNS